MDANTSDSKKEFELDTTSQQPQFQYDKPIIDQILNKYGYGFRTWLQIMVFFFSKILEGTSLMMLPLLVFPFRQMYSINSVQIFLISSCFFVGTGLGSFISGYVSSLLKRALLIQLCIFFFMIFFILMAMFQNLIVFCICRFITGVLIGILLIISQCYVTEYLPIKYRSLVMCFASSGYAFGGLVISFIFLIFMPDLEPGKIKITLLFSSCMILLIFIYAGVVTKDSPRNLILHYELEEGFEILESLNGGKLSDKDKKIIVEQVHSVAHNHVSTLKEIFTDEYFKTTIFLSISIAIIALGINGPILVSVFTVKSLGENVNNNAKSNYEVIINQIIIMAFMIPMQSIGGIFSEWKFLGRKLVMCIFLLVSCVFFGLSCIFYKNFSLFLGIALSFLKGPSTLTIVYAGEVYNTIVRDKAVGFMSFFRSIGGLLSQIIYLELRKIQLFVPYYFTISILFIAIVLIYLLPYETSGVALDQDHSLGLLRRFSANPMADIDEEKQSLKKE
jgi:SP family sugar:H+ symporter-like MFS transporter